jgi:hypothetical protein
MPLPGVRDFVLSTLRLADARVSEVAEGRAYRAPVPPSLAAFFPGRTALSFTFDVEYADLHADAGVEYVAPGYPLLDRLIEYARARFRVVEATLDAQPLKHLGLRADGLELQLAAAMETRVLLGLHFRASFRSDEYAEELFEVWTDPGAGVLLTDPPERTAWKPVPAARAVPQKDLQAAFGLVFGDLNAILSRQIARYEEDANLRLNLELRRLKAAGAPTADLERAKERFRLEVRPDLIFAELLHYPVQRWRATFIGDGWRDERAYRWDAVARRWLDPPTCPQCGRHTFELQGCDAGRHVVCADCGGRCSGCGAGHCSQHPTETCARCGIGFCADCLAPCDTCGARTCGGCRHACGTCERTVCEGCRRTCAVCGSTACRHHAATCHVSGDTLCPDHAATCSACGRVTHPARLAAVEGHDGLFCPACTVACAGDHDRPRHMLSGEAATCAGEHASPHHLCPEHRHRCALHSSAAWFCRDHLAACGACGRAVCPGHQQRSELSGQTYCSEHVGSCQRCRRLVGSPELRRTADGLSVCLDCARPCHACVPDAAPWSIDALQPCPACVARARREGTLSPKRPTPSREAFVQDNPQVAYCASHLTRCHVCDRGHCADHVETCPHCGLATCPDHLTATLGGGRACDACRVVCPQCPPDRFYAPDDGHLRSCTTCDTRTCDRHARTCEACGATVCQAHARTCELCHGVACPTCAPGALCRTCAGMRPVGAGVLAALPLDPPPQRVPAVLARADLPDGTVRLHVSYVPAFANRWQALRALVRPIRPVIAVIVERDGRRTLLRAREVDPATLTQGARACLPDPRARPRGGTR